VVPVYNRARVVVEALDSVLAQTRLPDRLVIVDDGSTDGTPAILDRWVSAHRNVAGLELVRQENRGVSAARNRGVSAAGPVTWIAFLDSDDLWPPDFLERMAGVLGREPGLVAASADRLDVDDDGRRLRRFDRLPRQTTCRLFVNGSPGTPNTVFRATAFAAVGGYDERERSLEDYHLMLRLSLLGGWGHAPGRPVLVRRSLKPGSGGAPNLSRQDPAWRRRQAEMLERFIRDEGGAAAVPEKLWRRRLAHVWYRAGRHEERAGRPDRARTCYDRSLELAPGHINARVRRALSRFARERMDSLDLS
jgi:glycosyltransferase involved in cell wall biosynthesis